MPSVVKLKKEHLVTIVEVLEDIVNWKSHNLSAKSWAEFEKNWLPSIIDQIQKNEFTINQAYRNTPLWYIDQVQHSRVLNSSRNPRNAVHLTDTLKGRQAMAIMRAAAKGQLWYDSHFRETTFSNLFTH